MVMVMMMMMMMMITTTTTVEETLIACGHKRLKMSLPGIQSVLPADNAD
jgi:hypothetical protein